MDDKPIGAPLNRNLGHPVALGEAVEAELDTLATQHPKKGKHD
jgi:hypothetical protein